DEPERMTDVQTDPTRVREHDEHEPARSIGEVTGILGEQPCAVGSPEHVLRVPPVLPRALDLTGKRGGVPVLRNVVGERGHAPESSGRVLIDWSIGAARDPA